uniref:HhH-GPD domain-containing protein n=2 Tax=cellular organisms TaxID=131567 RepID=A0A7C3YMK6_9EURY
MLDNLDTLLEIFHHKPLKGWVIDGSKSPKWWGELTSPEEIAISAILVQLTRWENVEKALENLRRKNLLDLKKLSNTNEFELQELIKPVGLRRLKAKRLIEFSKKVMEIGGLNELCKMDAEEVRSFLSSINGIGLETADAITLFALNKPTIPISENTLREFLAESS